MKTRVYKIHLLKTLNFYNEKLTEKFGPLALNEAVKELIRIEAVQIQQKIARTEKTNSWQIPIKVQFFDDGRYTVIPENDNQILVIE